VPQQPQDEFCKLVSSVRVDQRLHFNQGSDLACVEFVLPGFVGSGNVTVQVVLKRSFV